MVNYNVRTEKSMVNYNVRTEKSMVNYNVRTEKSMVNYNVRTEKSMVNYNVRLIIVESTTKVKTIQNYLYKSFEVVSSFGHIVNFPEKSLGIDRHNDF
ncbi:MAG: toprim domain-containing protein [Candidatus Walczuchella monophlebidarum]